MVTVIDLGPCMKINAWAHGLDHTVFVHTLYFVTKMCVNPLFSIELAAAARPHAHLQQNRTPISFTFFLFQISFILLFSGPLRACRDWLPQVEPVTQAVVPAPRQVGS